MDLFEKTSLSFYCMWILIEIIASTKQNSKFSLITPSDIEYTTDFVALQQREKRKVIMNATKSVVTILLILVFMNTNMKNNLWYYCQPFSKLMDVGTSFHVWSSGLPLIVIYGIYEFCNMCFSHFEGKNRRITGFDNKVCILTIAVYVIVHMFSFAGPMFAIYLSFTISAFVILGPVVIYYISMKYFPVCSLREGSLRNEIFHIANRNEIIIRDIIFITYPRDIRNVALSIVNKSEWIFRKLFLDAKHLVSLQSTNQRESSSRFLVSKLTEQEQRNRLLLTDKLGHIQYNHQLKLTILIVVNLFGAGLILSMIFPPPIINVKCSEYYKTLYIRIIYVLFNIIIPYSHAVKILYNATQRSFNKKVDYFIMSNYQGHILKRLLKKEMISECPGQYWLYRLIHNKERSLSMRLLCLSKDPKVIYV